MVPTGARALSPTKVTDLSCPYRFQKKHREGAIEMPVPALVMGQLVHEVAAEYCQHLHKAELQTDYEGLWRIAEKHWRSRPGMILPGQYDEYRFLITGLEGFFFEHPEDVAGVEMRLAFDKDLNEVAWDSDAVRFGGIIDIYLKHRDQSATMYDWTTAAISGSFGISKDFQTRWYGVLLYWKYGIEQVTCKVRSLRTNAELEVVMDLEELKATEREMFAELDRLERVEQAAQGMENWPTGPGKACGYCRLACPAIEEAEHDAIPLRVDNADDAQGLLARIVVMGERRDKLRNILQAWCEINGVVKTNGMMAGYFPGESKWTEITEDLKGLLDGHGVPLSEVVAYQEKLLTKHAGYKALTRGERKLLKQSIEEMTDVSVKERWAVKRDDGKDYA